MITLLIGHRGVGKSTLLKRILNHSTLFEKDILTIDLDKEIEMRTKKSIDELFADGELLFRQREEEILKDICLEFSDSLAVDVFIALGAGYQGQIPPGTRCLWIRRNSDKAGRIFFDRPCLEPDLTPLEEWKKRYSQRQVRFTHWATEQLLLSEGFTESATEEVSYLTGKVSLNPQPSQGASLTLLPSHFRSPDSLDRYLDWGPRFFELRDDLLSPYHLRQALEIIPKKQVLLSFRCRESHDETQSLLNPDILCDWPLEWGPPPHPLQNRIAVLSLHERSKNETVSEALTRLERNARPQALLKASLVIQSWDELLVGDAWALKDPERRSFLPRSLNGQWSWYRLWKKFSTPLTFVREADGSSPDQPTLLDWLRFKKPAKNFAAILGYPVDHSLTCSEQHSFFTQWNWPVLRLPIDRSLWTAETLSHLHHLGLRAAAVTAPLKPLALAACKKLTKEAQEFQSTNTLIWDPQINSWRGHNTDAQGFKEALGELEITSPIAVWGGRGTLKVLKEAFPQAALFSARTGQLRKNSPPLVTPPQTLVVAHGQEIEFQEPPQEWRPRLVLDLNYTDNSPGRHYALKMKARYQSGLAFFRQQALHQRVFWESYGR